jgi:hypothetical protein
MKGQYGIIPMIVGGILTLIIASVMIYAVFFPVTTNLNANVTASTALANTTSGLVNSSAALANVNVTMIINGLYAPLVNYSTLTVFYGNATIPASLNATGVSINNILIGNLPAPSGNTSFTFNNITTTMLYAIAGPDILNFTNTSYLQNATFITNATMTYYYSIFGNIPASQQSNFGVLLLLAGILVIIVALVVFLLITKSVS